MACVDPPLLGKLKNLVNEIDGSCSKPCGPCCPPATCSPTMVPHAVCCMVTPPPILAPTRPEPVKPLQLPCPCSGSSHGHMSEEEAERTRYANFYNNYNIDWHQESASAARCAPRTDPSHCRGTTLDGQNPCCENYQLKKNQNRPDAGCPTGFKPCTMKLTPPPCCHPCGVWCAEIQPCPPKPRKKKQQCGTC